MGYVALAASVIKLQWLSESFSYIVRVIHIAKLVLVRFLAANVKNLLIPDFRMGWK